MISLNDKPKVREAFHHFFRSIEGLFDRQPAGIEKRRFFLTINKQHQDFAAVSTILQPALDIDAPYLELIHVYYYTPNPTRAIVELR